MTSVLEIGFHWPRKDLHHLINYKKKQFFPLNPRISIKKKRRTENLFRKWCFQYKWCFHTMLCNTEKCLVQIFYFINCFLFGKLRCFVQSSTELYRVIFGINSIDNWTNAFTSCCIFYSLESDCGNPMTL